MVCTLLYAAKGATIRILGAGVFAWPFLLFHKGDGKLYFFHLRIGQVFPPCLVAIYFFHPFFQFNNIYFFFKSSPPPSPYSNGDGFTKDAPLSIQQHCPMSRMKVYGLKALLQIVLFIIFKRHTYFNQTAV